MSRIPMGSARIGQDPYGPSVNLRFAPGLVSQGIAAELVAADFELDRTALDEYASRSHQLANAAATSGDFDKEIVPVFVNSSDGSTISIDADGLFARYDPRIA